MTRPEHRIAIGRRVWFARHVSCDCGWYAGFLYGRRTQEQTGAAHLSHVTSRAAHLDVAATEETP